MSSGINIGTIVAQLTANTTQFTQGMASATASLASLATSVQGIQSQLTQLQQTQAAAGQSSSQVAAAYLAMAQAINTQTQAYAQAQAASLAFRQAQSAAAAAARIAAQEAREAAAAWNQIVAIAAGAGLVTSIQGLIRTFREGIVESLLLAAKMQDLHVAFRAAEGSSAAANKTLSDLFATAQRLGVEFTPLAQSFERFELASKGTTLEGERGRQVFEQLTAGMRLLGRSPDQITQGLDNLTRLLQRGEIGSASFTRQLAIIPGVLNLLATGFGVSTQEMQRLLTSGIIPVTSLITALGEGMTKLGASSVHEPISRLSTTFANLKNETSAWMTAMGNGLSTVIKPFLETITATSEAVRKLFNIKPPGIQAVAPAAMSVAPSPYTDLINKAAYQNAIDPGLLSHLIQSESNFNPNAVSSAGAIGLGQLMPATAAGLRAGTTPADLRDPQKNVTLAAQYLADMLDMFRGFDDQVKLALAAYNAGPGNVQRAMSEGRAATGTVSYADVLSRLPKPEETGPYVSRVLGAGGAGPAAPEIATGGGQPGAGTLQDLMGNVQQLLKNIPEIQKDIDGLSTSGYNFAGVLDPAITTKAEAAGAEFTKIAGILTSFPDLLAQMTPEQKKQVEEAMRLAAVLQLRATNESEAAAQSIKHVQQLVAFEAAQQALQAKFEQEIVKERQAATQQADLLGLGLAPEDEAFRKRMAEEQRTRIQEAAKDLDIFGIILSPEVEKLQRQTDTYLTNLQTKLNELRAQGGFGPTALDARLGAKGDQLQMTPGQEHASAVLRQQIQSQERLNYATKLFEELGNSVGSAWSNALTSIAQGTATVAQAFRSMAQSILQSMAQIASQEAFKSLIKLGVGLIGGTFGPSTAGIDIAGTSAPAGDFSSPPPLLFGAQGGAIINKPTAILAGENPGANPEFVLNTPQMKALMASAFQAGPSAGGQATGGISIINVSSREQGEQEAIKQRQQGRQVIVNEILSDMAKGENSSIVRMMRTLSR